MRRVAIRGGELFARIERATDPDAEWIVLAHGLATDHRMWDPQIAALTRARHVLRYDARGHGASSVPPPPYAFDDLVDDALAVMDAAGVARAAFMGLSLGGMTGLGLALRAPARLTALVCACARADAPSAFLEFWRGRLDVLAQGGMDAIAGATVERWFSPAFRAASPGVVARFDATARATPADGYRGGVAALMGLDYKRNLGRIAAPTLFVAGAEDVAAPPQTMREMADAVPGARFAEVAQAGHIANAANPAEFDRIVTAFLAGAV